ncbi:hypothetical protein SFRURICE_019441 [Spodoptera frugiperda]|nr:hypothetical protein SFRURICE_019441 [Spodoptera frugiperda]
MTSVVLSKVRGSVRLLLTKNHSVLLLLSEWEPRVGLRTTSKDGSLPDQNLTRAYGASSSTSVSKSHQTTTDEAE